MSAIEHQLAEILTEIADRGNVGQQAREKLHHEALNYQDVEHLPLICAYPIPTDGKYQPLPHREVFANPVKMFYNQLLTAWDTSIYYNAQVGDDLPYTIRADFGTVLIASMFNTQVEQVEDNPPWIRHDNGPEVSYDEIIDTDPNDLQKGWVTRVLSQYEFYHEQLDKRPELKDILKISLPDLQGPFDNLELILGSDVFMDFYSKPEKIAQALHRLAEIQVNLARLFGKYETDNASGMTCQHGFYIKGNILLRNDSCIMVGPDMYRDQIRPADSYVLQELGGGSIHSCGDLGRLAQELLTVEGVLGLDFGQSEMNDVPAVYAQARENKKPLYRVAITADMLKDGFLRDYPTGIALVCRCNSIAQAKEMVKAIKQA